jgi:hypothetical protein
VTCAQMPVPTCYACADVAQGYSGHRGALWVAAVVLLP